MRSLVSYVIPWFIWFRYKGSFQSAEALRARIQRERKTISHHPPQHLRTKFIVEEREVNGFPVYDIAPKSEQPHKARVLHIHGGAFVFEVLDIQWTMAAELAEGLNAVVTVPVYPLAPEHKLSDMYDMLNPIHDEMVSTCSRENVPFLLVGDSCGGSLGLVITQQALKANKPIATRIILNTPVVDSSVTNPDMRAAAPRDPFHDMAGFEEIRKMISPDMDPKNPIVSPIYGDLRGLPPMMVFVAENDLLAYDARRFIEMAREKGSEVEVVEGAGMVHVWPSMPFYEGGLARRQMIEWFE